MYKKRFKEIADEIDELRIGIYSGLHIHIDDPDDKTELDDILFSVQSKLRYEVKDILDCYELEEVKSVDQKEELYQQQKAIYQPISAKEARELANEVGSETCELELQAAMQAIYQAIRNGEYKCYCYTYLHHQCINKLTNNGYMVKNCSSQKDGTIFEISWEYSWKVKVDVD